MRSVILAWLLCVPLAGCGSTSPVDAGDASAPGADDAADGTGNDGQAPDGATSKDGGGSPNDAGGASSKDAGSGTDAGGSADASPDGASSITASQACDDHAVAECARLVACAAFAFDLSFPDLATCEARNKLSCMETLAAPGSSTTPDAMEQCALALPGTQCTEFVTGAGPAQCLSKAGLRANGAACFDSGQCLSKSCHSTFGVACGVCRPLAAVGESCAAASCAPNLVCNANGVCAEWATTVGAPCAATYCISSLECFNGTCIAPAYSIVGAGNACTATTLCGGGATCTQATPTTAVCAGPVADGASCNPAAGPRCSWPATCLTGTCKFPNPSGC